jgi:hypothetical protein
MGTEKFANGQVIYRSHTGNKTCIDSLKNDAFYRFSCRCGCGAEFGGYGKDLKAGKMIGAKPPTVTTNTTTGLGIGASNNASALPGSGLIIAASNGTNPVEASSKPIKLNTPKGHKIKIRKNRAEAAMKIRPFVSDRYILKAIFKLSDDEIDKLDREKEKKYKLSNRNPPGIGDIAWSISDKKGPYVVVEYDQREIKADGGSCKVWHAIVKTPKGKFSAIPLADLVPYKDALPADKGGIFAFFKSVVIFLLMTSLLLITLGGFATFLVFLMGGFLTLG